MQTQQTGHNAQAASHDLYQQTIYELSEYQPFPDCAKPLPNKPLRSRVSSSNGTVPQLDAAVAEYLCQETVYNKEQLCSAWRLACQDATTNIFSASLGFSREDDFFTTLQILSHRTVFTAFRDLMMSATYVQSTKTDSGFWSQTSRDSVASQASSLRSSYASLGAIPEAQDYQHSASLASRKYSMSETDASSAYMDSPRTLAAPSPGNWTAGTTTPVGTTPVDALSHHDPFFSTQPKAIISQKDQKFSAKNKKHRKFEVQCTYCKHTYESFTPFYTHEAEHHDAKFKYTCPCCSKESETSNGISTHLSLAHKDRDKTTSAPLRKTVRTYKLACACGVCGQFFDLRTYPNPHIITLKLSEDDQKKEVERRKDFLYKNYHQHIRLVHQGDWSTKTEDEKRFWYKHQWKRTHIAYAFITSVNFLQKAWASQFNNANIATLPWESLPSTAWADLLEDFEFYALRSQDDANAAIHKAFKYLARCRAQQESSRINPTQPPHISDQVSPSPAVVTAGQQLEQDNTSTRPMSGIEGTGDFALYEYYHAAAGDEQMAFDCNNSVMSTQSNWPLPQQPAPVSQQAAPRSPTRRFNASLPPTIVQGSYINGTGQLLPSQLMSNRQNGRTEPWHDERNMLRQRSKSSGSTQYLPMSNQF